MPYRKHLDILKQGMKNWNQWREKDADSKPDLRGADLRGADEHEETGNESY